MVLVVDTMMHDNPAFFIDLCEPEFSRVIHMESQKYIVFRPMHRLSIVRSSAMTTSSLLRMLATSCPATVAPSVIIP